MKLALSAYDGFGTERLHYFTNKKRRMPFHNENLTSVAAFRAGAWFPAWRHGGGRER
jgi:hypothetical protein